MLSILIPTYNFDCSKLVKDLHSQACELSIDFEILVYDDCSPYKSPNNQALNSLDFVEYKELKKNIGRAAIRNLLAKDAKYSWLLFIDCDMKVSTKDFIYKYISEINSADVICGSHTYPKKEDIDKKYILHWKYGIKRETKQATKNLMTSNFLIKKSIFLDIKFKEYITRYGYEDTIFGMELKSKSYSFNNISNNLIHIGLNNANEFIAKTRESIENLDTIYKANSTQSLPIHLMEVYQKVLRFKLDGIISITYILFQKVIENNLRSTHPYLLLLDIYKLGYLSYLSRKNKDK